MKFSNKILTSILVTVMILISVILVLVIFIMISFNNEISNYKDENYLQEDNNTIIVSGIDGYIYKINNNLLFYVLDDKIEIKKTELTNNGNYSDLVADSKTILSLQNAKETYYLNYNENFYVRNKKLRKVSDMETVEVKDFQGDIEGDWTGFQET